MSLRPAPAHAPRVPFALLVLGLLVGALVLLLALNTASAANEVRRHDLAAKDASISVKLEQLRNEVAASRAPGNLARVAAQLGMVPADNPAFFEVGADGKVTLLGSPAPATAAPVRAPAAPKTNSTARAATAAATAAARTTPASAAKTTPTSAKTRATTAATAGHTHSRTSSGSATKSEPAPRTPNPAPRATTTLPGGAR